MRAKIRRLHALCRHLRPALPVEEERRGDIGEDPLAPLLPPPPALHPAPQKDQGSITSVQKAVHARRPRLALFPAPHLGGIDCLAPDQDAAGPDLDLGLNPDPRHGHHPHGPAIRDGEMFTAAESPGGSGGNMR